MPWPRTRAPTDHRRRRLARSRWRSASPHGRQAQRVWAARRPEDRRRHPPRASADELGRRRARPGGGHGARGRARPSPKPTPRSARPSTSPATTPTGASTSTPTTPRFDPFGVVAVIPPWNFPVAIPAGGVLAALAAGNAVILKPAPETPRCAEIVAECCWAAGVPGEALQFVRVPEDEVGRRLDHRSATRSSSPARSATAELFRSWKPDLRLFAETSGKNAIVITPERRPRSRGARPRRLGVRPRRPEVLGRQPGHLRRRRRTTHHDSAASSATPSRASWSASRPTSPQR